MAELSRWCGRCGTGLRSGARFCTKCGQRVIDDPLPAEPVGPGAQAEPATSAAPTIADPPEPGATQADLPAAAPYPGPDAAPRNEWSDWYSPAPYSPTAPSGTLRPPEHPPTAYQPTAYRPTAYQEPQSQQPALPYPGRPQPYRAPFEPTPGAGPRLPPPSPGPTVRLGPPPGPDDGGRRSRRPLIWSALATVIAVAVLVGVLLLHPFSDNETAGTDANSTSATGSAASAAASSATASASAAPRGSASSAAVTERQAAATVAGMLASSVTDRTAINAAYADVDQCGPNLGGDAAVFNRAVSSRRALLARLAAMPGRSTLPPALLADLTGAWQASMAADQSLATWADDEVSRGCVAGDTRDRGYQASLAPDNEATEAKIDFTAQWNPIATRYGLTTYQQSQL